MPESQRKKRQKSRPPAAPEDALVRQVEEFVSKMPGVTIDSEMAGDWDSLGMNVHLPGELPARDLVALGNALLELLTNAASSLQMRSGWIVGLYHADDLLRVVKRGDRPRHLCTVCGHDQDDLMGERCLVCGGPLESQQVGPP